MRCEGSVAPPPSPPLRSGNARGPCHGTPRAIARPALSPVCYHTRVRTTTTLAGIVTAAAALAASAAWPSAQAGQSAVLPDTLQAYLDRQVKLDPAGRTRLLSGQPVTK